MSKTTNLFSKFKKDSDWKPFNRFAVKLCLVDIVGGIPKNPKLIEGWVNATNKDKTEEERKAIIEATREELPDLSDDVVEKTSVGFKSDENGLYIEGRQLKAMLKEAGNIIKNIAPGKKKVKKEMVEGTGITNLKNKVADQMFVEEVKVHLGREKPDEIEERPIHVMTAQGPRDALKRVEICYGCEIGFTISLRRESEITRDTMFAILDYNQMLGLGADRSQGRGRFEVLSVEAI